MWPWSTVWRRISVSWLCDAGVFTVCLSHNRDQEPPGGGTENPVLIAVQHYAKPFAFSEIVLSPGNIEKAVDADDG